MRTAGRKGIVRPKSLRDMAVDHLRTSIIDADFELGEMLSENSLSEELQISKTPIHEALVVLQSQGLVEILPQRGARVFTVTKESLLDLCDYRLLIEEKAFGFACERNGKQFLRALEQLLGRMSKAWAEGGIKEYLRLDTSFHALAFEFSDSACLQAAAEQVEARLAAIRTHIAGRNPVSRQTAFDEHHRIVELVRRGQPEAVPEILREHVYRLLDLFISEQDETRQGPLRHSSAAAR